MSQYAVIQGITLVGDTAIVHGIPGCCDDMPEDHKDSHNCDAMGCGYAHVLARIKYERDAPTTAEFRLAVDPTYSSSHVRPNL